ncbi:MAG: DUF4255 domain-containing protein [Planctomycetes bacterium]|nr:DUF4255 domain-containing protein [Planctomycetota bacterium]
MLKSITLTLQRMLERGLVEALGREVPVVLRYDPSLDEQVGLLHVGVQRRGEVLDREFEVEDGVEQFRNPPIGLRAQYLLSTWALPPEDQVLLGAVLRVMHDNSRLDLSQEDEDLVGYSGVPEASLDTLTVSEHRELATALGVPFGPSVGYFVDFNLRSAVSTPIKRVRERVTDFRKIEG